MFNPFELKDTLSANNSVDLDDSLNAKKAFGALGYYKTPNYGLTKYPDQPLFDGIKKFQADNGLKKDGVMNPGGETARTLGNVLGRQAKKLTPSPASPSGPTRGPLGTPKQPALPSLAAAVAKPVVGLLQKALKLPMVTDEAVCGLPTHRQEKGRTPKRSGLKLVLLREGRILLRNPSLRDQT